MAIEPSTSYEPAKDHRQLFVWREFLFGSIAGAFGEGMMHPLDTVKTRIQSQSVFSAAKNQVGISALVRGVWAMDGLSGFYRGIAPAMAGSLASGATYFGVIESTKKWIEESHPKLGGHWALFISGALGDTLGSCIYVPCEVMKQRMQVQGSRKYWTSVLLEDGSRAKHGMNIYGYYSGMFHAGCSIFKEQGLKGLYVGYGSTIARDMPFAGLLVTFYEAFKNLSEYGQKKLFPNSNFHANSSLEGLLLGGLAGGCSAYLTTPLDVVKTRLQVQGMATRYNGWADAVSKIWLGEGLKGMFRGSIPRVTWYIPASALTFMAVEFLREQHSLRMATMSIDKKSSSLQEIS